MLVKMLMGMGITADNITATVISSRDNNWIQSRN